MDHYQTLLQQLRNFETYLDTFLGNTRWEILHLVGVKLNSISHKSHYRIHLLQSKRPSRCFKKSVCCGNAF